MRVLLSTYGSRGDVEPRGHDDEGPEVPTRFVTLVQTPCCAQW